LLVFQRGAIMALRAVTVELCARSQSMKVV
jgi:hypothetical protein